MGVFKLKKTMRGAPRLRMENEEEAGIRFTTSKQKKIFTSSIYDISETGISFVCSRKYAPSIDEIIMMDFAPVGSAQLACMGRVVRLETPSKHAPWASFPDTVKVGVAYYNLPGPYKKLISDNLKMAFSSRNSSGSGSQTIYHVPIGASWIVQNWQSVLATIALLVGAFFAANMIWESSKDRKPDSPEWSKGFFEKIKTENK